MQVNPAGTLTVDDFDATTGFLIPEDPDDPNDPNDPFTPPGTPDGATAQFVYDGLGRLIVQKTGLGTENARATHLYYDGVRRIMFTHLHYDTPLDDHYERDLYYDGVRRIAEHIHYDLAYYPFNESWDKLEYAWGPDYVDELAFAIRDDGVAQYPIQDANYNIVGWIKAIGAVLSQYTYGPYGDLRAAEVRPNHDFPPHAIGHQGLFFVRLDGDPADPPLEVGAKGLYYNRNRWYRPDLGRFMQRDVNETALPIITAMVFNGESVASLFSSFSGQGLYSDEINLYAYASSNPVSYRDPAGLFSLGGLLGSTAVRSSLMALEIGSGVATGLDFYSAMCLAAASNTKLTASGPST